MSLGSRIKDARHRRGLKQADIAGHFKIKPAAVSQWETDETRPDTSRLRDLADMLGVTVDWLTSEGDDPPPSNVGGRGAPPAVGAWPRDLPVYGTAIGGNTEGG